jgi:REP element-mobilizing transposase RayT
MGTFIKEEIQMNKIIYHRKHLRLKHYDYSAEGFYFITICGQNRVKYFGEIVDGQFIPNDAALMIEKIWLQMLLRFPFISQHDYVLMPNHFHAIVEIKNKENIPIGNIVGAFKSLTTNEYIKGVREHSWMPFKKRLWQRNYYEHVIRNEISYVKLVEYIQNNPLKWEEDMFFM